MSSVMGLEKAGIQSFPDVLAREFSFERHFPELMSPKYSLSNARLSNMTRTALLLCICHFHACHTLCPAPSRLEGRCLVFLCGSVRGEVLTYSIQSKEQSHRDLFWTRRSCLRTGQWKEWSLPTSGTFSRKGRACSLAKGGLMSWAS